MGRGLNLGARIQAPNLAWAFKHAAIEVAFVVSAKAAGKSARSLAGRRFVTVLFLHVLIGDNRRHLPTALCADEVVNIYSVFLLICGVFFLCCDSYDNWRHLATAKSPIFEGISPRYLLFCSYARCSSSAATASRRRRQQSSVQMSW
jgi:hypothetical protein